MEWFTSIKKCFKVLLSVTLFWRTRTNALTIIVKAGIG